MRRSSRIAVFAVGAVASCSAADARSPATAWLPRGIVATHATLADVLAANERASGSASAALSQRSERWTYAAGTTRIAVDVAVRDGDWETRLVLDGLTYAAGRSGGARWRGDGNGVVHGVQADLQGDPLDRAPQAVFRIDPATTSLAGEARLPAPAWVLATDADGEKPAFLYVDQATGTIVREVMRDGARAVVWDFGDFAPVDGYLRARRWHVRDGERADDLDVTVDAIAPQAVESAAVALPERREFVATSDRTADLSANFDPRYHLRIKTLVDGVKRSFLLDCGTTSITIDRALAARSGGATLGHAVLADVRVGPVALDRVSTLVLPDLGVDGILGLDFFYGHVVEIDYRRERVRVLSRDDATAAFADPKTVSLAANVDQGVPLVAAGFGTIGGDAFVIDTGSPKLYVSKPFAARFADVISRYWTPAGATYVTHYLEGGIAVQPYVASRFDLATFEFRNVAVGAQIPTSETDDITFPFDGIVGTDVLQTFDVLFDYDGGRIGLRS